MAPARVATPSLLALVSLTVLALALSATEGYKLEANVVEVGPGSLLASPKPASALLEAHFPLEQRGSGGQQRVIDRIRERQRARHSEEEQRLWNQDVVSSHSTRSLANVFDWLSNIWQNIKQKVSAAWEDFLDSDLVNNVQAHVQQIALSNFSTDSFLAKVGAALEDLLDENVLVDFEIPDLVESILDGLGNSTTGNVFMAYMKDVASLGQTFWLDLAEDLANGTILDMNLKQVAEKLSFSQVEEIVHKVVEKTRLVKRKMYFVEAVKDELEESFEKIGDFVDNLDDKLGGVVDKIEEVADVVGDSAEDAFLSIKSVTKLAVQAIKNSTLLDIDLDGMAKSLMQKIGSVDLDLIDFDFALTIMDYIFELVREKGLSIDGILTEAVGDLVADLQSENSTVVDLIGELDESTGKKLEDIIERVNNGDLSDLKIWSKIRIFSEIAGVSEILFPDEQTNHADEVGDLNQNVLDYNSVQEQSPSRPKDYLETIFEVLIGRDFSRPKAITKPLPCLSVLIDLIVNAKEMNFNDILSLVMDTIGLLFRGGQKYEVPIPLDSDAYLSNANVVFDLKLSGESLRPSGLKEKALVALIEILAEKTKVPKAKIFLQKILYRIKSTWKVRLTKASDGTSLSSSDVANSPKLRGEVLAAYSKAMNVPPAGVFLASIAQSERRSLLQTNEELLLSFTSSMDAAALEQMEAGSDQQGYAFTADMSDSDEIGSMQAVLDEAAEYSADISLTAEEVDATSQLYGSGAGGNAGASSIVMEVSASELNQALATGEYSSLGLNVDQASSMVAEDSPQFRRENAVDLDVLFASSRAGQVETTSGNGGGDNEMKEILVIAGLAVAGALMLGSLFAFVVARNRSRSGVGFVNEATSKPNPVLQDTVTLTPSYNATFNSKASMDEAELRDRDLDYDCPPTQPSLLKRPSNKPGGVTTRVMNPVFIV